MAAEVFFRAKEVAGFCSVTYPLPEEELDIHGLCLFLFMSLLYVIYVVLHTCIAVEWQNLTQLFPFLKLSLE